MVETFRTGLNYVDANQSIAKSQIVKNISPSLSHSVCLSLGVTIPLCLSLSVCFFSLRLCLSTTACLFLSSSLYVSICLSPSLFNFFQPLFLLLCPSFPVSACLSVCLRLFPPYPIILCFSLFLTHFLCVFHYLSKPLSTSLSNSFSLCVCISMCFYLVSTFCNSGIEIIVN